MPLRQAFFSAFFFALFLTFGIVFLEERSDLERGVHGDVNSPLQLFQSRAAPPDFSLGLKQQGVQMAGEDKKRSLNN